MSARVAREDAYFAGVRLDDADLHDAAAEDEQRRAHARARQAEAIHEIHAPMGGVRDSDWGRTGPESIADFSDVIWCRRRGSAVRGEARAAGRDDVPRQGRAR